MDKTRMRYVPTAMQRRGPDGRKLCLVCDTPVPPRRSSYCGDECYLRNRPAEMRNSIFARDRGVCALCGVGPTCSWPRGKWDGARLSEWEMDHIIPVAEGGGLCGLDGYRTLCKVCHGRESGALRKRLNAAKRPQIVMKFERGEHAV